MSSIKIMTEFEEITQRLKTELNVSSEGEVAKFLGMTHSAFSERKKRNSFPDDKLIEIVYSDPTKLQQIDLNWVLRGQQTDVLVEDEPMDDTTFLMLLQSASLKLAALPQNQQHTIFQLINDMYTERKKCQYYMKLEEHHKSQK